MRNERVWWEHPPKVAGTHRSQHFSRVKSEWYWGDCLLGSGERFLPRRRTLQFVSASSTSLFHPCTCQSSGWAVSFQPLAGGNKTARQKENMGNPEQVHVTCDIKQREHAGASHGGSSRAPQGLQSAALPEVSNQCTEVEYHWVSRWKWAYTPRGSANEILMQLYLVLYSTGLRSRLLFHLKSRLSAPWGSLTPPR